MDNFNTTSTAKNADIPAAQPAREQNIDAIVSFFESDVKPKDAAGTIGIELEYTIVHEDMSPVSYYEEYGIAWLLGQLQKTYPHTTRDIHGDLLGVSRPGEAVTLEPAAQVEFSAGPFNDLSCAQTTFEAFEQLLEQILTPANERFLNVGYHPTMRADNLELIPKRRYQFMDLYLGQCDIYARCMMRGSAATQVSIDYTSTADCIRKLRLAFSIAPLLALICDNTPVFEGEPRKHKLVRTAIWQHVDDDRCGLVPGIFSPDFTLRDYASYILDTPAILVPCPMEQWCYSDRTFGEIYADRVMTREEVEHAASMFFTDVRLKTYIEIRPADSMPLPYAMAYAALIKGLFCNNSSLDELDELFGTVNETDYKQAQEALMRYGYDASIYGTAAHNLCDNLITLAKNALTKEDYVYLQPLADLIAQRTTLADLAESA